jgi:hypothetical protein
LTRTPEGTVLEVMPTKPFIGVDTARCNHDTVDGETVILDATTGVLTLLIGIGPLIWERLVGGVDRNSLLAEVAGTYGPDAAADATGFLDELIGAGFVVELDGIESGVPAATAWPDDYAAPQIERYDDIADIMMMDPIHEVDKTLGWPRIPVDEPRDP